MTEQTIENKMYGTGWLTCHKCGLTSKEVKQFKKKARCISLKRCARASSNQPLSGKVWESKGPNDE